MAGSAGCDPLHATQRNAFRGRRGSRSSESSVFGIEAKNNRRYFVERHDKLTGVIYGSGSPYITGKLYGKPKRRPEKYMKKS